MNTLTLDTVRRVLRNALGRESFIASFVTRVHADEACLTASIDPDGVLRYAPTFLDRYVEDDTDLFSLFLHEVLHPLFGHFLRDGGTLENFAADLVINASIRHVFAEPSRNGEFFKKVYAPEGMPGLLRSDSRMQGSRYAALYESFYGAGLSDRRLSTGEVIRTLKALAPAGFGRDIVLLGSHRSGGDEAAGHASTKGFSVELRGRIADELLQAARSRFGRFAGYDPAVYTLFIDIVRTQLSIRGAVLQRFLTQRKMDRFLETTRPPRLRVTPIALRPSKRDLVLLSAGITPVHYHNQAPGNVARPRGLAVYLDVSGSVNRNLPEIVGLLGRLRSRLTSLFLFSNKVFEVPFTTLLAGHVQTTYGTDFDCIAQSVLERGYDKAVILTDGYARMNATNREELRKRRVAFLTILFGGAGDCEALQPFGDVVRLDEVRR